MRRTLIIVGIAVVACSKGQDAPKGIETALGTTGAKIDLQSGWRITDKGTIGEGHRQFDIEFGDQSGMSWKIIWCRTMPASANLDEFYKSDDACRNETKAGTKTTLPSGAFYAECEKNELGTDLHHLGAAVKIAPIETRSFEKDELMHCFANSSSPTADHYAIVKSLRAK
jgi:hypothetical protein